MPETDPNLPDTEQLLIIGCIAGNRASQTKLYDLYASRLLRVCLRYAKNREVAEEILHVLDRFINTCVSGPDEKFPVTDIGRILFTDENADGQKNSYVHRSDL